MGANVFVAPPPVQRYWNLVRLLHLDRMASQLKYLLLFVLNHLRRKLLLITAPQLGSVRALRCGGQKVQQQLSLLPLMLQP